MIKFESEAHLEEALLQNLDNNGVKNVLGFDSSARKVFVKNQVRLGSYGVADIIVCNCTTDFDDAEIRIIELKNRPIELQDVLQVARYRKAFLEMGRFEDFSITATILGTGIKAGDNNWRMIVGQIDWLKFVTFDIDVSKGLVFEDHTSYVFDDDPKFSDVVLQFDAEVDNG